VLDGVFYLPEQAPKTATAQTEDIQRLAALVVAPNLDKATVLTQLRASVDAVFLPRHIHFVAQLPRNSTGKLTAAALSELLLNVAALTMNTAMNTATNTATKIASNTVTIA
jgi:acyl-coenzyme A synthetase/AMP-(fatty) acid ligase